MTKAADFEARVMRLVDAGMSRREIAEELDMEEHAVRAYLFRKRIVTRGSTNGHKRGAQHAPNERGSLVAKTEPQPLIPGRGVVEQAEWVLAKLGYADAEIRWMDLDAKMKRANRQLKRWKMPQLGKKPEWLC